MPSITRRELEEMLAEAEAERARRRRDKERVYECDCGRRFRSLDALWRCQSSGHD